MGAEKIITTISDHVSKIRADFKAGKSPVLEDYQKLSDLVELVNFIDSLTFRNHYGEVLAIALKGAGPLSVSNPSPSGDALKVTFNYGDGTVTASVPVDQSSPTRASAPVKSEPTQNSNPHPTSAPKSNSIPMENSGPVGSSIPMEHSGPVVASNPTSISESTSTRNPDQKSGPVIISNPKSNSNIVLIASDAIWACDNQKCGAPNLVFEMQVCDLADVEPIRYKCQQCSFVGLAELSMAEIEAAIRDNKPYTGPEVSFELSKKGKKKSKQGGGEPKGTPLIDAIEEADRHMAALGQEVRQNSAAPQVSQASLDAIETQKGRAKNSSGGKKGGGSADATPFPATPPSVAPYQTAGAAASMGVSTEIKSLVEKVVQEIPTPEVNQNDMVAVLTTTVQTWPLDRLVKEWEAMTGKVYKQGVTVPDAMIIDVVNRLGAVPVGE